MIRVILVAAVLFTAGTSAAFGDDLAGALQPCRSLASAERLACFDRVLAARDSAAPVVQPAVVPAPVAAKPAEPPPPAAVSFGAERLAQADDAAPKEAAFILAKVTAFGLNAFQHFTVTLDNGQVWRQIEADTPVARLRGGETVRITRGFLDSYSLSIEGAWGSFKVKRIQ